MGDVPLEVPLGPSRRSVGTGECNDACSAWVQVLGEALDRTALSGGVTSFEDDRSTFCPVSCTQYLELQQLDLQLPLGALVLLLGSSSSS